MNKLESELRSKIKKFEKMKLDLESCIFADTSILCIVDEKLDELIKELEDAP